MCLISEVTVSLTKFLPRARTPDMVLGSEDELVTQTDAVPTLREIPDWG